MKDIQDIFYSHLQQIRESNLPFHVKKTAEEIAICRTNAMHGLVFTCPENHFSVFLRNSCNNRNCPTCQGHHRNSWNKRNKKMALEFPHYHLVFKLPAFCYPVFLKYYKNFVNILFESSKKSIAKILKYSQYELSTPGTIMVTHTYGEDNQLHPHLHIAMTAGGLSTDEKKWINYEQNLFSIDKFNHVYTVFLKKQLTAFYKKNPSLGVEFYENIVKIQSSDIYLSEKYDNAEPLINYLSKTVKGSSIHNQDILDIDNNLVKYKLKSGKTTQLNEDEFIRRFLLHVLPPQLKSVRYSGLYSSSSRNKLNQAKKLISEFPHLKNEIIEIPEEETMEEIELFAPHKYCPVCSKKMHLVEKVLPFSVPRIIYIKFGKDPPIEELFNRIAA